MHHPARIVVVVVGVFPDIHTFYVLQTKNGLGRLFITHIRVYIHTNKYYEVPVFSPVALLL